jgi:hypothetical protein
MVVGPLLLLPSSSPPSLIARQSSTSVEDLSMSARPV